MSDKAAPDTIRPSEAARKAQIATARISRLVDLLCEYETQADREWAIDYLASIAYKQEGWRVKIILEHERGR